MANCSKIKRHNRCLTRWFGDYWPFRTWIERSNLVSVPLVSQIGCCFGENKIYALLAFVMPLFHLSRQAAVNIAWLGANGAWQIGVAVVTVVSFHIVPMNGWAGGNKNNVENIKFGRNIGNKELCNLFLFSLALRPREMLLFFFILGCLRAEHDQVLCCLLFLSFFSYFPLFTVVHTYLYCSFIMIS